MIVTVYDRPDRLFFKIEYFPYDPPLEFEHLARHGVFKPVYPGDTVTDLQDSADAGNVDMALVLGDFLFYKTADFVYIKLH